MEVHLLSADTLKKQTSRTKTYFFCHGFDNYHTQFLVVKKIQFWVVESTCWMAISKSSCLILTVSCLGDYPLVT